MRGPHIRGGSPKCSARSAGGPNSARGASAALWGTLVFASLISSTARAAGEVREVRINRESVRVGIQGAVRFQRWAPVRVEIAAKGDDDAKVSIEVVERDWDGDKVQYSRNTIVSQLKSRPVELYFQPRSPGRLRHELPVTLIVRNGLTRDVLATETINHSLGWDPQPASSSVAGRIEVIAPERRLIGFLQDPGGGRSPAAGGFRRFLELFPNRDGKPSESGEVPETALQRYAWAEMAPDDLPSLAPGFEPLDVLIWAPTGRENLTPAQQRALIDWVAAGGQLIVMLGRNFNELRTAFPAAVTAPPDHLKPDVLPAGLGLLPAEILSEAPGEVTEETVRAALHRFIAPDGDGAIPPGPVGWAPLRLRIPVQTKYNGFASVRTLLSAGTDGPPLIVDGRFGSGAVMMLAVNPAEPPLADWAGAARLWRNVFAAGGLMAPVRELHYRKRGYADRPADVEVKADAAVDQAVEDFGLTGIGTGTALLMLIAYAVMAGPGSWFTLRHYNLLRWSWHVFAALVLVAGVLAYGAVSVVRGVRTHRNRLSVVDLDAAGGTAAGWNFDCVYCPEDGEFRLGPPNANSWAAPWIWTDDGDDPAGSGLAAETYRQTYDPNDADGKRGLLISEIPIRNHVKKFLTRWWSQKSPGTVEVGKLHVTVDPGPENRARINLGFGQAERSPFPQNKPPELQYFQAVNRVEWKLTSKLPFGLTDCIIVMWPTLPRAVPETVIGHSEPNAKSNQVQLFDEGKPGKRVSCDPFSTQGACVVRLGKLSAGATVEGAASLPAEPDAADPQNGPPHLRTLSQWLNAQRVDRYPQRGSALLHGSDFPLNRSAVTLALLSLQMRMRFDPALDGSWRVAPKPKVEDRRGRLVDQDDNASAGVRSLAPAMESLSFLDITARMRPDEALLLGVADPQGDTDDAIGKLVPAAELQTAGGSKAGAVERTYVVIRIRLPFTVEPTNTKAAVWLAPSLRAVQ